MDSKLTLNVDRNIEVSPKTKSLLESIKVPEGFDYMKELSDQLSKKYLHRSR